jgi:hypothetical protein
VVVENEVDDAEHHDGQDDAGGRSVDDLFAFRQLTACPHE